MAQWLSKTQGPESTNKKRINAYCLPSIEMEEWVCFWGWEKRCREIVGVTDSCFKITWYGEPKNVLIKDV